MNKDKSSMYMFTDKDLEKAKMLWDKYLESDPLAGWSSTDCKSFGDWLFDEWHKLPVTPEVE